MHNDIIFNSYPDSIGKNLSDIIQMLERTEFNQVFSLFYILPTIFNSDLDHGFSIIDYDLNRKLVLPEDLVRLNRLGIKLKLDLVVNHISVASPEFSDLLAKGDDSKYKDFFIDWNEFWKGYGEIGAEGYVIPEKQYLDKLFMRKPGLPILKVNFPEGNFRFYWNTFYQKIFFHDIIPADIFEAVGNNQFSINQAIEISNYLNNQLENAENANEIDFGEYQSLAPKLLPIINKHRSYLGQMDLNAESDLVWHYYESTLQKLSQYGCALIRLDAFAYLHKKPDRNNFFNKPETWDYLDRLRSIAKQHQIKLLPEIHSVYGEKLHNEISGKGYPIYDFFFPGLVIHALEKSTNLYLIKWINEVIENKIETVTTLGTHDGIPLLDLIGSKNDPSSKLGILPQTEIDEITNIIIERGGIVKDLYGPDGKKISYYQINATFFSALGANEQKLVLARAIQIFMPGIPQIWYLDLFAGKNDLEAVRKLKKEKGSAGHKEINRSVLSTDEINNGLKTTVVKSQIALIRLRRNLPAFMGELSIENTKEHMLTLTWEYKKSNAKLIANLRDFTWEITYRDLDGVSMQLTNPYQ